MIPSNSEFGDFALSYMNKLKYVVAIALLGFTCRVSADEPTDRRASILQLRQLFALVHAFAKSHNDTLPNSFEEVLAAQKTLDATILIATLATDKSKPSYELLLPGKRLTSISDPSGTILIRALYTLKDGRHLAAFVDGHTATLDAKP